jgi:hypothetical protein
MTTLNLHDIKEVIITENAEGKHSQHRDIVFLDAEGNEVFAINVFSIDKENGINIRMVANDSFINWQFENNDN